MNRNKLQNNLDNPPHEKKLKLVRECLQSERLDAFLIPKADEHQGEHIPACAERLLWLTGFTGSAGFVIVTAEKAALFVDGRYTLQAQEQVDSDLFEICPLATINPQNWLKEHLTLKQKVGFDPWLHTHAAIKRFQEHLQHLSIEWVPCQTNLIDQIWQDQPSSPQSQLHTHEIGLSGQSIQHKLETVIDVLKTKGADACILTLPTSIAWLFNVRSHDIPYTPAPLCFAVIYAAGNADLFINPSTQSPTIQNHLGEKVRLLPKFEILNQLKTLTAQDFSILIDPQTCPWALTDLLTHQGTPLVYAQDPCLLPQACKNATEVEGARQAHIRDSVALVNFFAWLYRTIVKKEVSEQGAAQELLKFRQRHEHFVEPSFPTISSAGPHGAIIHYCPTAETDRIIKQDELYLVDSGGQYFDGTTDVTRVLAFSNPSHEQKDRFTRVLKGHIALAQARFPKGTTGQQLDILARYWLWQAGLDFEHGTGHGVGSYLSVHEGPQNISKARSSMTQTPLQAGMLLSNEPGYYKDGAYGIRIENVVVVKELENIAYEYPLLGFETLTLAPICLELIDLSLMNTSDINWLNRYHEKVSETLTPLVDETTKGWLQKATEKIS